MLLKALQLGAGPRKLVEDAVKELAFGDKKLPTRSKFYLFLVSMFESPFFR
ncbi:hypothetical protein BSG1_09151 [Bacillus sp. SG-1]|nr:hypothetical protein BSG1_09151 [Bacillus sp. SG-1]